MNIIICGAGRVGFTISKMLTEQDHSVTVIDVPNDQGNQDCGVFYYSNTSDGGTWDDYGCEAQYYYVLEIENDEVIEGCTDSLAENFNEEANSDDGSCDYGNSSLYFNGPDYIDYIESVQPQGNELSLSAWFKTSSDQNGRIISKVTPNENIFFLMLHQPGYIRFNVMHTDCNSDNNFNDDQWHHAIGTWDGEMMK